MKKINGITTFSTGEQIAILHWYIITKRLLCTIIMILIAATATLWYIRTYYARPCKPCISPAYAAVVAKKHAAYTAAHHNQKKERMNTKKRQSLLPTIQHSLISITRPHLPHTLLIYSSHHRACLRIMRSLIVLHCTNALITLPNHLLWKMQRLNQLSKKIRALR